MLATTVIASAEVAETRVVYLVRDGLEVRPGHNDARTNTSSLVTAPTIIPPTALDDDTWNDTVGCLVDVFAPFDLSFTERDPGDVQHVSAVFGGKPAALGLPANYRGISPFAKDCGIVENAVVFTFTDAMAADAHKVCYVMAQELAHSYGLDHEMLTDDIMSQGPILGARTFHDEAVACGETAARPCGLTTSACRPSQNSYQLLAERLPRGEPPPSAALEGNESDGTTVGGCAAAPGASRGGLLLVLGALITTARRRRVAS